MRLDTTPSAFAFGVLLAAALSTTANIARAESSSDLGAVEDAYRAVDFEGVVRLAETAIRSGGHDPRSMTRLELLLGVANAALDRPQPAQAAFIRLLGIDPTQKLERELSPRLRAPYLEARGFWSSNQERLAASARMKGSSLDVSLSDPARMVRQIRVSSRAAGQAEFQDSVYPAAATVRVALDEDARQLEVALALLDDYGNTLGEHGTKLSPLRLERDEHDTARPRPAPTPTEPTPKPSYLLPTTLSVLGLASTAAAIGFHVQRERAAREWNGHGCERPGSSRGVQCAAVERRLERDEWLSIGFYAGGGALLTLGVISFIASEAAHRERASAAVSCDALAASTVGVWCAGRF